MPLASYRAGSPLHPSTNHTHVPRSKTPNPIREKHHAAEPLNRSRTPLPYEGKSRPHRTSVDTYTWIAGQQYPEARRPHMHKHSSSDATGGTRISEPEWPCSEFDGSEQQRLWEEQAYAVDVQVRMIREQARQIAAMREAERTRLVQEEVRRIQAKIQMRREIERRLIMEERHRAHEEEAREWERRKKAAADKAMAHAWKIYESQWAAMTTSSDPLSFHSIPWPMLSRPSAPSSITMGAISAFLFSQTHSTAQTPKERIRDALRRWHPDRFGRLLKRVTAEERPVVEEAVGIVARHLNELLNRQPIRQ